MGLDLARLSAFAAALTNERGYLYSRDLPDGRVLDVQVLLTGTAQLTVSPSRDAVGWTDGF